MLLSIEPDSEVPLYVQLRNQIVAALVQGELSEGDSLPSVRQLGVDLGINLHTVNKAYKVLEDEGYLKIFGRRGAIITARPSYNSDYLRQLEVSLSRLFIEACSHGVDATLFAQTVQSALGSDSTGQTAAQEKAPQRAPRASFRTDTRNTETGTSS